MQVDQTGLIISLVPRPQYIRLVGPGLNQCTSGLNHPDFENGPPCATLHTLLGLVGGVVWRCLALAGVG